MGMPCWPAVCSHGTLRLSQARINSSHLQTGQFNGQMVRAVGKLTGVDEASQQVQLQLAGEGERTPTPLPNAAAPAVSAAEHPPLPTGRPVCHRHLRASSADRAVPGREGQRRLLRGDRHPAAEWRHHCDAGRLARRQLGCACALLSCTPTRLTPPGLLPQTWACTMRWSNSRTSSPTCSEAGTRSAWPSHIVFVATRPDPLVSCNEQLCVRGRATDPRKLQQKGTGTRTRLSHTRREGTIIPTLWLCATPSTVYRCGAPRRAAPRLLSQASAAACSPIPGRRPR